MKYDSYYCYYYYRLSSGDVRRNFGDVSACVYIGKMGSLTLSFDLLSPIKSPFHIDDG